MPSLTPHSHSPTSTSSSNESTPKSTNQRPPRTEKPWVDPHALPNASLATLSYPSVASIAGTAPLHAKQLALNTFAAYGVGDADAFGHAAGRKVRFVRIDVDGPGIKPSSSSSSGSESESESREVSDTNVERRTEKREQLSESLTASKSNAATQNEDWRRPLGGDATASLGTTTVTAIAELVVDKTMVNGNGMMHGGCIAYLIDNCGSVPLVALGVLRGKNGVGVTQALNILFQAPAPLGSTLKIVSTTLALGGRSMTARCEIFNNSTGRLIASAFLNKMEPKL